MNRIVFDTELDAARDNEMMKGIVAPPKLADSVRLRESGLPAIPIFGRNVKNCQNVRKLPKWLHQRNLMLRLDFSKPGRGPA